ncbi:MULTISPECIES: hypothetical protein [Paraburkholderia]|uniref:hypothetical protein n=1 Tax=Paraburkholderia TaxID=1822464 RepID=UPI0013A6A392|nr:MULTISPECIES: hypothetical protein [Paraburkholderia]MDH6152580.1 hypothetical protein [Paraburkholderia sp. WSM4179]
MKAFICDADKRIKQFIQGGNRFLPCGVVQGILVRGLSRNAMRQHGRAARGSRAKKHSRLIE